MEKKIVILNRRKKRLSAILHTPKKKTNKIVILIHGFKGDKDYLPIFRNLSGKIEEVAVIRFDCCGSGESDGLFEKATVASEIRDLKDVIKYVRSRGYTKIALIGFSLGSTVCLKAYNNLIKMMILWSPPFDHRSFYKKYKPEMERQGFVMREKHLTGELVKLGKNMWKEFGSIRLDSDIKKVRCPVFVVFGRKDKVVKYNIIRKYYKKFSCIKELFLIKGGDHDFLLKRAEKKVVYKTIQWIRKYL